MRGGGRRFESHQPQSAQKMLRPLTLVEQAGGSPGVASPYLKKIPIF
jgi:hypothetical protein